MEAVRGWLWIFSGIAHSDSLEVISKALLILLMSSQRETREKRSTPSCDHFSCHGN